MLHKLNLEDTVMNLGKIWIWTYGC